MASSVDEGDLPNDHDDEGTAMSRFLNGLNPTFNLVVCAALVLTACGSNEGTGGPVATSVPDSVETTSGVDGTTTPSSVPTTPGPDVAPSAVDLDVYWLDANAETLVARPRTTSLSSDDALAHITAAVEALLIGPSGEETAAGLSTAIPDGVNLHAVTTKDASAPTEVTVDLSSAFESGGGSAAMLGRLAQITWTVTAESGVSRVRLAIDGEPVDVFSAEGIEVGDGMSRDDFSSMFDPDATPEPTVVPVWGQSQIGPRDANDDGWMTVVNVAADDTLNVRAGAGTGHATIGRLSPGVMVPTTGKTTTVNGTPWFELVTPLGAGWANGKFLTATTTSAGDTATAARAVIDDFAERLRDGNDVADLVSADGLWIAHHAPPVHYPNDQVDKAISDPATRRWGSNALGADSPEITPQTFREAVADPFVSVWLDDDTTHTTNQIQTGPNGRVEAEVIPSEFSSLPFVSALDPGDNPDFGGLDWQMWMVSVVTEDGQPRVFALTLDEWAP